MKKIKLVTSLLSIGLIAFMSCSNPSVNSDNNNVGGNSGSIENPKDEPETEITPPTEEPSAPQIDKENARLIDLKDVYKKWQIAHDTKLDKSWYPVIELNYNETIKIVAKKYNGNCPLYIFPEKLFLREIIDETQNDIPYRIFYITGKEAGDSDFSYDNSMIPDDNMDDVVSNFSNQKFYISVKTDEGKKKNEELLKKITDYKENANIFDIYSLRTQFNEVSISQNEILYIPNVFNFKEAEIDGGSTAELKKRSSLTYNETLNCYEFKSVYDATSKINSGWIEFNLKSDTNTYHFRILINSIANQEQTKKIVGKWVRTDKKADSITFYADGTYIINCPGFYDNSKGNYVFKISDQGNPAISFTHDSLGRIEYKYKDENTLVLYAHLYFTCPDTTVWTRSN